MPADDNPAPTIRRLIHRLGSERWRERTKARRRLVEHGLAALPALRDACDHKNPEIASQARRAISEIWDKFSKRGVKQRLTVFQGDVRRLERLLEQMPNLLDVLIDINPLARHQLLDKLEELRTQDCAPVLVEIIGSNTGQLRTRAALLLAHVGGTEVNERIEPLLASSEGGVVVAALHAAAMTHSRTAELRLLKLLDHQSAAVSREAAGALLMYYENPTGYAALRGGKLRLSLGEGIKVRYALQKLAGALPVSITIDPLLELASAEVGYDMPPITEGELRAFLKTLIKPLSGVSARPRYGTIFLASRARHAALPDFDPAELVAEGDPFIANMFRNSVTSADFQDTRLNTALIHITGKLGTALELDREVNLGSVTTFAFFEKLTVENALRSLLLPRELCYYLEGAKLRILPVRKLAEKLRGRREEVLAADKAGPMLVYLNHPDRQLSLRARNALTDLGDDAIAAAVRRFGPDAIEHGTGAREFLAAAHLSSLPGSRAIDSVLGRTIAFVADDLTLATILSRLSGYTGVDFVLGFSPDVHEELGKLRITCKADIITVREAFEQVVRQAGLVYRVRPNDVFFSTESDLGDYAVAGSLMAIIEREPGLAVPLLQRLTGRLHDSSGHGVAEWSKWWKTISGY